MALRIPTVLDDENYHHPLFVLATFVGFLQISFVSPPARYAQW